MSAFLFAFIAVLLSGIGARDQITVASLTRCNGPNIGLLVIACLASCATAAAAAWAGSTLAPTMTPNARNFLAALALGWAGLESLFISPGRKLQEPTRSLGAAGIVLLAHQVTDAARFLVFAMAIAFNAPLSAALGGAAGGAAMLSAAWAAPEYFEWNALRWPRRGFGLVMLIVAIVIGGKASGRF